MESTASPPSARPPRGWPLALLIGFLAGTAGAFLAVPVSDWAMEAHHVSAMEGGRACAAIALWAPLAFATGMVAGVVISLSIKRGGFAGFALRLGLSLVAIGAIVFAAGGIGYATADHPPLIDGQNLALEIETRVPSNGRSIDDLKKAAFNVALVASVSDRNYSDLLWTEAKQTGDLITVPARAVLLSRTADRRITAGIEGESRQIFNVTLPGAPKKIDDTWSEWIPPQERFDHSKPAPNEQYLVRYRVRFASEYSPTPHPTLAAEERPAPEESATPEPAESP